MRPTDSNGLIGILLLIILAIVTFSYFNIDVKTIADKPETQAGVKYATDQAVSLFEKHFQQPLNELWKTVITDGAWKSFVEDIKQGTNTTTDVQQVSPQTQSPSTP